MRIVSNFIIIFSLFLFGSVSVVVADNIKIAVITDIHFLSKNIAIPGTALTTYENSTGRNVDDLHTVLELVLDDLIKEEIDVLLITGDITNHGELQSHIDFIEKLKPLKESGIRIYVTPGNHDVNIPNSKGYEGDESILVASITDDEFLKLYDSYGYRGSFNKDTASLSYVAEINKDIWVLSIDANRFDENRSSSITGGRIRNETMLWALQILHEAQQKGVRVLGMMHHGLVEHMPFQSEFFSEYLIEDWKSKADSLADAGLNIIFTGHFHSNDITLHTSPSGNVIYDVETASLSQYPFAYRIMNLNDSTLSIESRFIKSTPTNSNLEEEYRNKLQAMTERVAENRLNNLGILIPPHLKSVFKDMIVKLYIAHVKGDEVVDSEMMGIIELFASILGNEIQEEDYIFDFPPADNNLVIDLDALNR